MYSAAANSLKSAMSEFRSPSPEQELLAALMAGNASLLPSPHSRDFDDRLKQGHKTVSYMLTGPNIGFVTPLSPPAQKQRRRAVLADEIALAVSTSTNPNFANSVFVELIKLAEKKYGCLVGVDDDVIKYQASGIVKFFTLRQLRARMERARAV